MAKLDSRTKRKGLEPGRYHQEALGEGLYLRYRRPVGMDAGTWIARRMEEGRLVQARIGDADDILSSDGIRVLTYLEARKAVEAWAAPKPVEAKPEGPPGGVTVEDVINAYVADARNTRKDPKTAEDSLQAAGANIIPDLGAIRVVDLTVELLKRWLNGLISHGRRKTGRKRIPGEKVQYQPLPDPEGDEEAYDQAVKRRKSSANRNLALLKAALNLAVTNKFIPKGEEPWSSVPAFKGATGQRKRFLDVDEIHALVAACDSEFRRLVSAALFTGARYGELIRAKVGDLDLDNGSLWVDGKGRDTRERHVFLTEEGESFFRDLVEGRSKGELLFTHYDVQRKTGTGAVAVTGGPDVPLSSNEAAILGLLLGKVGRVVRYSEIEETLWAAEKVGKRTVNTLNQLRLKLKDEGVLFERMSDSVRLTIPGDEHLEVQTMVAKAQRGQGGPGWRKYDAQYPMEKAVELAGIEPVVFHELRHTYASDLIKRGVQLLIVAKQLGHADTRMVEKHYGHLAQATKRDAIRTGATFLGISGVPTGVNQDPEPPGLKATRMVQSEEGRGPLAKK
jgi:integrase